MHLGKYKSLAIRYNDFTTVNAQQQENDQADHLRDDLNA